MATSSFTSHLLAISSCDRLPSSYRRFSYCLSSLLGVLTSAKVFASASHSLAACASPFLVTLQIIYSIPRFQPLETNPFLKTSPPSKVVGFIRPYFSRGRGEVSTLNRAKSIKTKASARYVLPPRTRVRSARTSGEGPSTADVCMTTSSCLLSTECTCRSLATDQHSVHVSVLPPMPTATPPHL